MLNKFLLIFLWHGVKEKTQEYVRICSGDKRSNEWGNFLITVVFTDFYQEFSDGRDKETMERPRITQLTYTAEALFCCYIFIQTQYSTVMQMFIVQLVR